MASRTATTLVHPPRDALSFTTVLAALSDPLRLGIVAKLGQLGDGGELACVSFALPVSKSTQSGHFRVLREAGVVRQRDDGTRRLNKLRRDDLDARFPGLMDMAIRQGSAMVASVMASCPEKPTRERHSGGALVALHTDAEDRSN